MVARVDDVRGNLTAISRTYFNVDASRRVDRRFLGPVQGGAVRLAPAGRKLGLAEGIETALSVMTAIPDGPVWAALSTSGLRTIELPAIVREVTIFADADREGLKAARDAAQRLVRQGRRIKITRPPDGFGDFNDVLRSSAG
jgi:hypothetical protein